jgi:HD-GYP domain-containing protein (c-di-GMP phosphodiesterase class II)
VQTSASSIHRSLLIRIAAAAVLLAATAGGLTYVYQRQQVAGAIAEQAALGIERLRDRVTELRTVRGGTWQSVIQEALDDLARQGPHAPLGRFVVVGISDRTGRELGRVVRNPAIADKDALPALPGPEAAASGTHIGGPLPGDDPPLVPVLVPVAGPERDVVAYVRGLFEVSRETVATLRRGVVFGALVVALSVLATAAVIYPLVRRLTGQLTTLSSHLLDANLQSIRVLGSAIAKRDSDTDAHNYRVTVYAVRLAERAGLADTAIRSLIKGAFLHDVGKIGVPDRVLLKPGRLDAHETTEMRRHVPHGLDIIAESQWLQDAEAVVGFHHEKYDGTGYYQGLSGTQIPIIARIFSIADVFDALTSERPYKKPLPLVESLRILRDGAGNHFDPALVETFEGIAEPLYRLVAEQDDRARSELAAVVRRYFGQDLGLILRELRA